MTNYLKEDLSVTDTIMFRANFTILFKTLKDGIRADLGIIGASSFFGSEDGI